MRRGGVVHFPQAPGARTPFLSLRRRALAPLAWLRASRAAQARRPGLRPGSHRWQAPRLWRRGAVAPSGPAARFPSMASSSSVAARRAVARSGPLRGPEGRRGNVVGRAQLPSTPPLLPEWGGEGRGEEGVELRWLDHGAVHGARRVWQGRGMRDESRRSTPGEAGGRPAIERLPPPGPRGRRRDARIHPAQGLAMSAMPLFPAVPHNPGESRIKFLCLSHSGRALPLHEARTSPSVRFPKFA